MMDDAVSSEPTALPPTQLSVDAREWIQARIRSEFDRDRAFLKELLGFAFKVLAVAGSVVLLVLTITGISTYNQIKSAILAEARTQVRDALQPDNPASPFARTREELVAEALIDAYRIKIARHELSPSVFDITVHLSDRDRLLNLVTNSTTPLDTFRDALDILALVKAGDSENSGGELYARLGRLLSGDNGHEWIRAERAKRILLIEAMRRGGSDEHLPAALDRIFAEGIVGDDLLEACLRATADAPSEKLLTHVSRLCDVRNPRTSAFAALAAIDPTDPRVAAYVNARIPTNNVEETGNLLTLASGLAASRRDPTEATRLILAILESAMSKRVLFGIDRHGEQERTVTAYIRDGRIDFVRRKLNGHLVSSNVAQAALKRLVQNSTGDELQYRLVAFREVRPFNSTLRDWSIFTASLDGDGALLVEDGRISEAFRVQFFWKRTEGLVALTIDERGNAVFSEVVGFESLPNITFDVRSDNLDQNPEEPEW